MLLTILMPCLNEEKTVGGCVQEALQFIQENKLEAEVLVVDNGSEDASIQQAREKGARVISCVQRGYGSALSYGISHAKGSYIIMGDCDGSYDFTESGQILEKLLQGAELVIGNRFNPQMEKGAMPGIHRYFGVPFLSAIARMRYHTKVKDFHCGLRGFPKEQLLALQLKSSGMEYATEMIGAAAKRGYVIEQIPITLRKDGRDGASHLRTLRDGLRHLFLILRGEG